MHVLLLTDNTVGRADTDQRPAAGDTVTVCLRDENGMPISVTGQVAEVLEGD